MLRTLLRTIWPVVVFGSASSLSAAGTNIILKGPTFTVSIAPQSAHTPNYAEFDGFTVIDSAACGSCQGVVVRATGGGWLGSCHGGEVVYSARLWVDGTEVSLLPGGTYMGEYFRLDKESALGPAIGLTTSSHFNERGIVEDAALTTHGPGVSLSVVYGFLSTHSNDLTQFVSRTWLDEGLNDGATDLNDNSQPQLGACDLVGQFDADAQRGVVTYFAQAMAESGRAFIWDRPCDNKLYYRFLDFANPIPPGTTWTFRTTRLVFWSEEKNWVATALSLPSDVNRDTDVDLADFAAFQREFGTSDSDFAPAGFMVKVWGTGNLSLGDWRAFALRLAGPK